MNEFRTEHDLLGEKAVPAGALWGIHTARALENFPLSGRSVRVELVRAFGLVKLACTRANRELGYLPAELADALERACVELSEGALDAHFPADALQGGAGTSLNMNVNEVLANRSLQILGHAPGEYSIIHPNDHVNLHQSTNDAFPTALRVAAIGLLRQLERELTALQESFQRKEKEFDDVVKVGRTEMQDAVLITLGREMSAYAEAFARDRWRVYKCEERLRVVNLGGTAVGTGLSAPRQYIFRVVDALREITGLGLARAENLVDATQNADAFVEVMGILKTVAANLLKISGDLRLLSSGPDAGFGELILPARQAGSSIMPGKVNPVIPEAASQCALLVFGYDAALTQACALGSLELNPFLPLVAECLLSSLGLLANACRMLRANCVDGLAANRERCRAHAQGSTACATALLDALGYERATALALESAQSGQSVRDLAIAQNLLSAEEFDRLTSPEAVTRLGSAPRP